MPNPPTPVPTPTIRHLPPHAGASHLAEADPPNCYRSDERLWCEDAACPWRSDCLRLVAVWKR